MKEDLLKILNKHFPEMYITDEVVEKILSISLWRKFEGTAERYPIFVKFKGEDFDKTNSYGVLHSELKTLLSEIEMYMPVPPLPEEK